MDQNLKDLNLLLLFLSGWEEESGPQKGEKVFRSWKGYLFDVLNELESERMIYQPRNTRSLIILPEGIKRALEIKSKVL